MDFRLRPHDVPSSLHPSQGKTLQEPTLEYVVETITVSSSLITGLNRGRQLLLLRPPFEISPMKTVFKT